MARTDALSIVTDAGTKAKLAEIYAEVITNVQKRSVSEQIKNKLGSGDATAGSVEFKRFQNASVDDYGTAREAGEGKGVKADPVTVNLDQDKEIVEEVEKKDLKLYGIAGMAEKRKANHIQRFSAYLDRVFFATAEASATALTVDGDSSVQDQLEKLIQHVEVIENDYVDGVDRDLLVITLKGGLYGRLRNYMDTVQVPSVSGIGTEEVTSFHGVRILANNRQTADAIIMVDGAVAQPVVADEYDAEKIPLSNAFGLELFFSYGSKAVTPDLIFKATITAKDGDELDGTA